MRDDSVFCTKPERSVYDVALLMGIGAMTVCQDERAALGKLRAIFHRLGVAHVGDLSDVEPKVFRETLTLFGFKKDDVGQRYPLSRVWYPVVRILSVSAGCERVRDVVLAHQFLIERHPSTFQPPVFTRVGNSTRQVGTLGRAVEFEARMRIQCKADRARRLDPQSELTVLVDSELGRDSHGDFEVPVIVAAFAGVPLCRRAHGKVPQRDGGPLVE